MIRLAVPIILLLLMLLGGTWVLVGSLEAPEATRKPTSTKERQAAASKIEPARPRCRDPRARAGRRAEGILRRRAHRSQGHLGLRRPRRARDQRHRHGRRQGARHRASRRERRVVAGDGGEARERRSQARIENEVRRPGPEGARGAGAACSAFSPTDADPAGGALRRRRDLASPEGPRRHGEGRAHNYAASRRRCRHGGAHEPRGRRLRRASPACTSPSRCRSPSSSTSRR